MQYTLLVANQLNQAKSGNYSDHVVEDSYYAAMQGPEMKSSLLDVILSAIQSENFASRSILASFRFPRLSD